MPQIAISCDACHMVVPVPEEDSRLLAAGGRIMIDCPECGAAIIGEPEAAWTFSP